MKFRFVIFLVFSFTTLRSLAAEPCLHYSGEPVTLTGKVKLQTFYGPPNYGENPDTDSRETQAILLLTKSICVESNPSNYEEAEQNQSEITLVPLNNANMKDYVGEQISVQGRLYHAHTGHHHTPVLIELKHIEKFSD
jgi:hypothetical protein